VEGFKTTAEVYQQTAIQLYPVTELSWHISQLV